MHSAAQPRKSQPHWGRSSAGRALQSHCRGQEFDPPRLHQLNQMVRSSAAARIACGHTRVTHRCRRRSVLRPSVSALQASVPLRSEVAPMRQRLRLDGRFSCLLAKRVRWASGALCFSISPNLVTSACACSWLCRQGSACAIHGGQLLNVVDIEKGPVPSPASNEIRNRLCFSGNLPSVVPTRVLLAWINHPWSRAHLSCLEFGNERII